MAVISGSQQIHASQRSCPATLDRLRSQSPFRLDLHERNRQDPAFRTTHTAIARSLVGGGESSRTAWPDLETYVAVVGAETHSRGLGWLRPGYRYTELKLGAAKDPRRCCDGSRSSATPPCTVTTRCHPDARWAPVCWRRTRESSPDGGAFPRARRAGHCAGRHRRRLAGAGCRRR